jgi:hypothetical protein
MPKTPGTIPDGFADKHVIEGVKVMKGFQYDGGKL